MMTKEAVLNGLKMYHDKLKDERATVTLTNKSSTVEGAMWYSIEDDLYWSIYICMNGSRIEIAYGQFRNRN